MNSPVKPPASKTQKVFHVKSFFIYKIEPWTLKKSKHPYKKKCQISIKKYDVKNAKVCAI